MICPSCKHEFTTPQDGREAVITRDEVYEAFGLIAMGRASDAVLLMRGLLAQKSTNDESEST